MVMSVFLGYLLGALSGYAGGLTDRVIMRVADLGDDHPRIAAVDCCRGDAFRARFFPGLAHLYGGGNAQPAGVALTGAAGARAMSLLRERDFMLATQVLEPVGASPAVWPPAAEYHSDSGGDGDHGCRQRHSQRIRAELSRPRRGAANAVVGNMMDAASSLIDFQRRPWLWMPPGIAIFLTVIAINVLGDGLRDAMDPNMKTEAEMTHR